jgi:hypothetical protein
MEMENKLLLQRPRTGWREQDMHGQRVQRGAYGRVKNGGSCDIRHITAVKTLLEDNHDKSEYDL